METFTRPRKMVEDLSFLGKKALVQASFTVKDIDLEIKHIIIKLNEFDYCFTIQCCYGHMVKRRNGLVEVIKIDHEIYKDNTEHMYQIAYIALVLANNNKGHILYDKISTLSLVEKDFVHFGSSDWFWEDQGFCNSYVIQVVPKKYKHFDHFYMSYKDAIKWRDLKNKIFYEIFKII